MPENEYHHVRVKKPEYFDSESFRVIELGEGIKATIGCPMGYYRPTKGAFSRTRKCWVGTEAQKILFPKDKYTRREAINWVKTHKLKLKRKKVVKKP